MKQYCVVGISGLYLSAYEKNDRCSFSPDVKEAMIFNSAYIAKNYASKVNGFACLLKPVVLE